MIVALRLETNFSVSVEKHEYIIEAYKRFGICIDQKGFMWIRRKEDEPLINMTYNTLTCFLRTDYKEWCEDHNIEFINAEFKIIYDRAIHDVFHYTKNAYANPERSRELGILKPVDIDDSQRL
jgi:hypothetical protein